MNLQGIVAVSGKPGLWKALAQNKTGYILESLDAHKTKLVANISTSKLASLHEITIFGLDEDIKLTDVFEKMKSAKNIPDAKADGKKLREFFREIAPDHDEEKVYSSDMKKVVTWYDLLKDTEFFKEEEKPAEVVAEATEAEKPAVKAIKPPVTVTTPPKAGAAVKAAAPKAASKPKAVSKPRRAE
jgi:hypothetical protein